MRREDAGAVRPSVKKNARRPSKASAHTPKQAIRYYHMLGLWFTARDVASAVAVVALASAVVWSVCMAYQVGYAAGVEWASA